jgi:hypothetical protein
MKTRAAAYALVATLTWLTPVTLSAQPVAPERREASAYRVSGLSLGVIGDGLVTTTWRWASIGADGLGWNAAVATAPQVFIMRALPLLVEIGPSFGIPFSAGALMVGAGGGVVGAVGPGGAVAAIQFALGGTAVIDLGKTAGLRLDYTRRYLRGRHTGAIGFFEAGVVATTR